MGIGGFFKKIINTCSLAKLLNRTHFTTSAPKAFDER
jgi:hypothetical protein